jgi:crotonobetainyl-CoA:carnitine CoA-transferase CaiB-like acyl-CoA transferase
MEQAKIAPLQKPFGPLQGVRVLDMTQMLAGPYATMMLADQGAEVIKIEPLEGELTRSVGPFHPEDQLRAFGGYFSSVNRNKKSLTVDIKQDAGRDIIRRLCDISDAVVENFRAGVMDRNELSYESLRDRNPRLVYASIRGFGDPRTADSPYGNWPAYDPVAQAMGGIMGITGPSADMPLKVGPGVGDIVPAMLAAFGVVSAILRARVTGQGQYVDVAMTDGVLSLCERILHQWSFQSKIPVPEGNMHPLLAPFGMVRAADGWVTVAAHVDQFWAELCRIIGKPELVSDPRFSSNGVRVANATLVYDTITAYTIKRTKRELIADFGGRIPFGPVYNVADVLADPHFKAREMVVSVEHPGLDRPVQIAGVPVRMSETPGGVHRRAPLLGEDADEVLTLAGYSSDEIKAFRRNRVVGLTADAPARVPPLSDALATVVASSA